MNRKKEQRKKEIERFNRLAARLPWITLAIFLIALIATLIRLLFLGEA